ncbi:HET-domain-containing protein [Polyplosphaeria fusca]|uniref:HET-domain-containing protein n=1 Tax=Polyplosphaeria fusca TaxID=682080 RepID=A0A9P4QN33_9PLEO|nr:HET-domain-containing protein [Polyplosphaeria fusca]
MTKPVGNAICIHTSARQSTPRWWTQFLETTSRDLIAEPWRVRADRFPSRNIPANTGHAEVFRLAREWLSTCKGHHLTCDVLDKTRDGTFFPPRLLKISESQTCHLLVPRNESPAMRGYVALSHCWGKNPPTVILTTNNMDQLKEGIHLSSLPKSFAEAIQTCQRLRYQYIWIDSLCIIQSGPGSDEDWQHHITIMDTIYANCELNIAIAHASDSTQGCFVDRDPDFIQTAFVYTPLDFPSTHSSEEDEPWTPHERTHLSRRAWIFQERLLSPRTLHFGQDRIFWECNKESLNGCLPHGLSCIEALFSTTESLRFSLPSIEWQTFVRWYNDTNLTYPSKDKMAAIGAVAKRFRWIMPIKYAAGIFLSSDPLVLLWNMDDGLFVTKLAFRSWASVQGKIGWWILDQANDDERFPPSENFPRIHAEVRGIYVDLFEPTNPYGQTRSAEIIVEGLISSIHPPGEHDRDSMLLSMQERLDEMLLKSSEYKNEDFYVLYLVSDFEENKGLRPRAYGLILTRASAGTYRRLGVIRSNGPDNDKFHFHKLEKVVVKIV